MGEIKIIGVEVGLDPEEVKNAHKEAKGLQNHYEGEIKKFEEQIDGLKTE